MMSEDLLYWRSRVNKLSMQVREIARGSETREEAAQRIADVLHEGLNDISGGCALARVFHTVPFKGLPEDLQEFARTVAAGSQIQPQARCLVLLGSCGAEAQWCTRHGSKGHKAIPLLSEEMVRRSPMLSAMFSEFGVPLDALVESDELIRASSSDVYQLFYLPEAKGDPHIPAQEEFVIPYGVRSVVGFGGPLVGDELFATLLFLTVHVSAEVAALFRSVALSAQLAILGVSLRPIFSVRASAASPSIMSLLTGLIPVAD